MWRVRFLLMLLLMFVYPLSIMAATKYASSTGSGFPPCTNINSPCSLNTGLAQTFAGDTLYLRAGNYPAINGNTQTINSGTSWTNAVTIAAMPGETATITGQVSGNGIGLASPSQAYIIFDGGGHRGLVVAGQSVAVSVQCGPHHIRFIRMEIRNASSQGVESHHCPPNNSHDIEFINNKIHHNGTDTTLDHGLYVATPGMLIDGNEIYNNAGYGLHIYENGCTGCANDIIARNNIIHHNGPIQGGAVLSSGNRILFYNNVVYSNDGGVELSFNTDGSAIYNNTITGNASDGIHINGPGDVSNGIIRNNIVYGNGSQIETLGGGVTFSNNLCGSSGTGCTLTGNPGFISAAGGDFHLQSAGSPAIDTGQNLSNIFTTDAEGALRAASGPWDLGAYVFAASGPGPTPVGNIARYLFEAGTGTAVADSSGQNHPCTMNSAAWGPGLIGTFAFTPTGTQYCSASGVAALRPTTQFGLAGWMKATTTSEGGGVIAALPNDAGMLYILPPPDGRVACQLFDGTNFPTAVSTTTVLNGVVHHVSCSYLKGDGVRIRIDNAQAPLLPLNIDVSYAISGTGNLEVGRSSGSPTGYEFIGSLDNVYVFDQEITAEGNTNLFNEQVPVAGMSIAHMAWFTPGVPNPSSQLGATDTNRANHLITTPLAWRFAVRKADAGSLTEYFKPMCIINTGAGFPAWTSAVELTNSFGAQGLRYYADASIAQGFPTSVLLPLDGFTAAAGKILKSPIDTTSIDGYDPAQRMTISQGQQIEGQYEVEFGSPLVGGEAVMCRLVRENGSLLDSYSNIMSVSLQGITPPTSLSVGGVDQGGTRQ